MVFQFPAFLISKTTLPRSMAHNVAYFLQEQSIRQPHGLAVRAPMKTLSSGEIVYVQRTFAELENDASGTAYYFAAKGIERGSRVLLMVKPGLDLIRVVFALFKMGAVPIVIDPGMGFSRFLKCVRHSKPEAIVGIPAAIWVSRIFRLSFRGVRMKVCVDRGFESKIAEAGKVGGYPVVDSAADELAAILFTSGSTGPAKGVCHEHAMFLAQVESIRAQYGIEPGEVDLPMLPVFALFNPALGMCTVVPEMNPSKPATVDPSKIATAILQNQVTNSFGSPALWYRIAGYCEDHELTFPSMKRILMAGAPVPPALMERMKRIIPNGEIHTPYGATEALPVSSMAASDVLSGTAKKTDEGFGTCVGAPSPGVSVRVIEPQRGVVLSIDQATAMPAGEVGEIIVQGPSVTKSYDQLPDASAKSKIQDGVSHWHRMGDLGKLDEQGRIWFCGRMAERVMTSEGPLYTDCCEAIFNRHPRVFRTALIDLGGGVPGLAVEPEIGHFPRGEASKQEFIRELKALGDKVSNTSRINHFFFEESFPVDVRHNAKIHRLTLSARYGKDR